MSKTIMASDIKKGWKIALRDGTTGYMEDNKKTWNRLARMLSVFGTYSLGEIPVWNIHVAVPPDGDNVQDVHLVKLSPSQEKRAKAARSAGF